MADDSINIKEYVDRCVAHTDKSISDLKSYIDKVFELNKDALQLANESMLARLESMNEFRAQIKEERANLATKGDVTVVYDKLNGRLCPLEEAKAFSAGKMWMVMAIFAGIPTVLALIALFT